MRGRCPGEVGAPRVAFAFQASAHGHVLTPLPHLQTQLRSRRLGKELWPLYIPDSEKPVPEPVGAEAANLSAYEKKRNKQARAG